MGKRWSPKSVRSPFIGPSRELRADRASEITDHNALAETVSGRTRRGDQARLHPQNPRRSQRTPKSQALNQFDWLSFGDPAGEAHSPRPI